MKRKHTVTITRSYLGRTQAITYKANLTDSEARKLRSMLEFDIRGIQDYEVVADSQYPVYDFQELERKVKTP